MSDLQKQIEAVERGDWGSDERMTALGDISPVEARAAYLGSLNAAKALHEALLPGWDASMHLYGKVDIYNDDDLPSIEGMCIGNPARA